MKIGSFDKQTAAAPVGERKTVAANGTVNSAAEPSAKVELSAGALLAAGGSDPVFDAEKVKRISDAIRDGKFEVNAEAIADKLIANAHELLSPKTR